MAIQNIQSNSIAAAATTTTGGTDATTLGKDAFMKLLVNQMKNQDPLSPSDNSAYISQLAEFSSLEQMQELNDNIVGLAVLQQNNALMSQLTQSSQLIGKEVRYVDPTTQESRTGVVSSVKIEDDLAVLSIGGKSVPLGSITEVLGNGDATETGASTGSSGSSTGSGSTGSGSTGTGSTGSTSDDGATN